VFLALVYSEKTEEEEVEELEGSAVVVEAVVEEVAVEEVAVEEVADLLDLLQLIRAAILRLRFECHCCAVRNLLCFLGGFLHV
jgi:hypothetical protein